MAGGGWAGAGATVNVCESHEVCVLSGANPTQSPPGAGTFVSEADKGGADRAVMDPGGQALKSDAGKRM